MAWKERRGIGFRNWKYLISFAPRNENRFQLQEVFPFRRVQVYEYLFHACIQDWLGLARPRKYQDRVK